MAGFKHSLKDEIKLPNFKNSLNFIVKEYSQGYLYAGSILEKVLYIIKPD